MNPDALADETLPTKKPTPWGRGWRTMVALGVLSFAFSFVMTVFHFEQAFGPRQIVTKILKNDESVVRIPGRYTSSYLFVDVNFPAQISDSGTREDLANRIRVTLTVSIDGKETSTSGRLRSTKSSVLKSAGTKLGFFIGGISSTGGNESERGNGLITIDAEGLLTRPLEITVLHAHT